MKIKPSERKDIMNALGLFTHIGLTMTIAITGSLLFGKWVDDKLQTSPLFLVVFILLGMSSAIYILYKIVIKYMK